jgi:superfamily II DNA or RNA helicase
MRKSGDAIPAGTDIVLVPATATLIKAKDKLAAWLGDGFLVLDEAHLFKSKTARRTQAVYGPRLDRKGGLTDRPSRILAMSGTFAPNHNGELYPHLRALAPETILNGRGIPMAGTDFEARYCTMQPFGPSRVMRPIGSANTDELRERFKPRVTIVTAAEVQEAFPHPRTETVRLDPADVDFDFLAAAALIPDAELRNRAIAVHRRITADASDDVVDAAVVELLRLAGQDQHLAHLRRAIGKAKIAWLEDLVGGRAPSDRPTLVFNTYVETGAEVVRRLQEQSIAVLRIYGATPDKQRDAVIEAVTQSRVAVALLQIDAAGAGLNFQAADTIVMLEPSWSPGVNEQAIGRACRIGQTTSVRILWPVIRNTIDESVMRVLKRKGANARRLWS